MRLEPSEEQAMLRETVARFLADRGEAAAIGAAPMPAADWCAMAEFGLFAFLLPERAGGMGGGSDDVMIVAETLGRGLAITPLGEAVLGAADIVARYGDELLVRRFVAPAMTGEATLALATGSVREEAGRVSGVFEFARWAPQAMALVVLGDDVAYVVALDTDSATLTPRRLADGTPAACVTLTDCEAARIALPPGAAEATLAMVDLAHAAEMIGVMALLYAQTADYVATRRQFGAAIATFQAVQHKMARMFVALEQARSLTIKAAATGREDADFVRAVRSAKAYVADAAQFLAEEAVQLHGGIGVTDELPVGRGLRRVMVLARLFGGAADARVRLAA
jgi:alkylation response protein AidB-like acyl-CoA dehydrogenase